MDKAKGAPTSSHKTRAEQLRKAQKILEQTRLALAEHPNAMVKYRLEMVCTLAEELANEAKSPAPGTTNYKPDKGPKEAGA
jgi:hypothetical protein